MMGAAEQFAGELEDRLYPLAVLAGPDATVSWLQSVDAGRLVAELGHEGDDSVAAEVAVDVMAALWPVSDPPAEWWATPLGRLLARAGGMPDAEAVTQHAAAAMLGVTRGTVAQLVSRGALDRHPDGGVLVASVLQRITRAI